MLTSPFVQRLRRPIALVACVLACQACGGSGDAPTTPADPMLVGATGSVEASNGQDALLHAELVLDGARIGSVSYPTPRPGAAINATDLRPITPGRHRIEMRVSNQAVNRTSWRVYLAASVLNARTGAPQYFLLPENFKTAVLANGESVYLDFEVPRVPSQ